VGDAVLHLCNDELGNPLWLRTLGSIHASHGLRIEAAERPPEKRAVPGAFCIFALRGHRDPGNSP
jgi:hypothetical protein